MSKRSPTDAKEIREASVALGRVICAKRKQLNMTQEALADLVETNRAYISELERGKKEAGLGLILRLARALQSTSADLMDSMEQQRSERQ